MCVRRGPDICPAKDDRDMIIQEILDADGIVLASPVYVNHATALTKNFIERLGYEGHRPRFYDKYAMVVAVCGMFGAKETNKYMSDILASFGFNVVSALELQIAMKTEKEKTYNHKKTVQAFDTFLSAIEQEKRNIPLGQIVRFNIFKIISESNKEHFEADYEYYKDKADFPFERNPLRKTWAKMKAMKALGEFMANR
jgi:multimeric flavodoxin WrbA